MSSFVKFMMFIALGGIILLGAEPMRLHAQDAPPPAEEVTPDPWPRTSHVGNTAYTIYQPQLDSWDGYFLKARAAVSIQPDEDKVPVFGVIDFTAKTLVDRVGRTVTLDKIDVEKLTLPSDPDDAERYRMVLAAMVSDKGRTLSLDRLEAMMAIENAGQKGRAVPVQNAPPQMIFTPKPAILIPIDGEPVWRPINGTSLQRVLNTRAFVALDGSSGTIYLHLFDGFVQSRSLLGPWAVSGSVPQAVKNACTELSRQRVVDPMTGETDAKTQKKPSLKRNPPEVMTATVPTELIVTEGEPDWVPISGTMLLYVQNTTADIFRDMNDQMVYIQVTGRWFRAPGFEGPWQYVAGNALPRDFAMIPDDSPKENVKASVPDTPQAQEAAIAAQIPQTAKVSRTEVSFKPQIDGAPVLRPIPDTQLQYVYNSPQPIILVPPSRWYAVQNGVWFCASGVWGPWTVAVSVPADIYAIPVSSPLYYVTYVKVYDVTPSYVVVGYTPGYLGTVVTDDGVVVYGTGYVYPAYISTAVWYPPPVTYGYAASVTWTPWTGWAVGFGFGWAVGVSYACAPAPYWGPMPYAPYAGAAYGPHGSAAVWGPSGWAATSGNVYQRYGSTGVLTRSSAGYNAWTGTSWSNKVGASYNSTTGRISAGQKASVSNVYTGNYAYGQRGATYNPSTGVSARGGTVTYGNANTGSQNTATWGHVNGPGGQSAGAAKVNSNYYASHDGNIYKNTGSGWEKYDNGNWTPVTTPPKTQQTPQAHTAQSAPQTPQTPHTAEQSPQIRQTPQARSAQTGAGPQTMPSQEQALEAQKRARSAGDSRSAGSSWGSQNWGGGFNQRAPTASPGQERRFGGSFEGGRQFEGGGGAGMAGNWGGGRFGGFRRR